jgi:hypothetical protein
MSANLLEKNILMIIILLNKRDPTLRSYIESLVMAVSVKKGC